MNRSELKEKNFEKWEMESEDAKLIRKQQAVSAIMGFVVGDALGVPVEFMSRQELQESPVLGMREYGTHSQPAGTWSDDSSMVVATLEWISELKEFPAKENKTYHLLMDKFTEWLMYGDYTPYGENFDSGITVSRALMNYGRGTEPTQCGGIVEVENGNGSLMRILPIALWRSANLACKISEKSGDSKLIFEVSSLTHAHARSKVGCFIYSKIIADIVYSVNVDKGDILKKSLAWGKEVLEAQNEEEIKVEVLSYNRIWDIEAFKELKEEEIKSSGYVVDTLEAVIWCFLNTDNYKDCVLKAVNLGEDTDTVGALAGGLAGLYYGLDSIPAEWVEIIPKKDWIIDLTQKAMGYYCK